MARRPGLKLLPDDIDPIRKRIESEFKGIWDLATQCGLSESTIHKFIGGERVSPATFHQICKILDLDAAKLIQRVQHSEERGNLLHVRSSNLQELASSEKHNYASELPLYAPIRGHDIHALKHLILNTSAKKVGVLGMAGIGKTVLVSALAEDRDVYEGFSDGIFYLLCGQERSLTSLQMQLATALGYAPQPFVNEQDGRIFLGEQIGCKKCLIILDDVWQLEQIDAFDALGANCKTLITTQNQELLTASGSERYEVKLLNEQDALALLSHWSGQDAKNLASAREVANQCEGLPLALALCGAQIRDGDSWEDLRDALQEAEIGVLNHQLGSIERALKISVDGLIQENAENGWRYQMLAVFSKNAVISEAAILTLWLHESRLNERKARQLITRLARKALLTVSGEYGKRSVRLHGLQHSYLCNTLDSLKSLNDKLLRAYQSKCSTGWDSGPNDGYYLEHLVEHLLKSHREDEVYDLLTTSPAWMQRKFKDCQGDTAYVSDVDLVLSKFLDPLTAEQLLLLSQLYTIRQAINWRASSYSDTDLEILVLLNRSTEALAYARLRSDAKQRFQGLEIIYRTLKAKDLPNYKLLDEMLDVATEIEDPSARDHAQSTLEEFRRSEELLSNSSRPGALPQEPSEILADGGWLNESKVFSNEKELVKQMAELVSKMLLVGLNNSTVENPCECVKGIVCEELDADSQALVLETCIKGLTENRRFDEAKSIAEEILVPERLAFALTDLALGLAQDNQLEEANGLFIRAKSISEHAPRNLGEVLKENPDLETTLLEVVEGLLNIDYIQEAEEIVRRSAQPSWRASLLIMLIHKKTHLDCRAEASELLNELREVATHVSDNEIRSSILQESFTLAISLDFQAEGNLLLADLLDCIEEIEDEFPRADRKASLIRTFVNLQKIADARALLQMLDHTYWYVIGLTHLVKAEDQQANVLLAEAFASVETIEDENLREEALCIVKLTQEQVLKGRSADEISYEPRLPEEVRWDSAIDPVQAQLFCKAFEAMGYQTLHDFLFVLAQWMPDIERVEQGLSLKIVQKAVRIAGWVVPEWIPVSELFLGL